MVLLLTVFKARVSLMTEENRLPRGSLKSREYIPVWVGERATDSWRERQTKGRIDRQAERHKDRQTERKIDKRTEKQTD